MNEEQQREYFASLTKEQLIEILINVVANEAALRQELDKVKGIIR